MLVIDLNNFTILNVSKCKTMCFSRRRFTALNVFYINGIQIQLVDSFLDLGVPFLHVICLLTNKHINKCISNAMSMLGFQIHISKEFQDPYAL